MAGTTQNSKTEQHTAQQKPSANAIAGKGISMSAVPVLQQEEIGEDKNPVQKISGDKARAAQSIPNRTGMPDHLKSGIENLSGMDMSDVKVHYNSSKPAQLNALAYAQGSDIHVGPGQEKHLPHEAWHVVQQRQGRVQATKQMKENVAINDDPGLEHEADVMGGKALQMKIIANPALQKSPQNNTVFQLETKATWSSQTYTWEKNAKAECTEVGKEMETYIDPGDIQQGQSANMNSSQTEMMSAIKKKHKLKPHELIKGHLLNDNVGGPAHDKNLFPITKGANGDHLHFVENKVKDLLKKKQGVYYKVEVQGQAKIDNKTNEFKTTVADWDHNQTHSSAHISNHETRVIYSDIDTAGKTGQVSDGVGAKGVGVGTSINRYKSGKGKLPAPAKSKSSLTGTRYELVLFTAAAGGSPILVDWDATKTSKAGLNIAIGKNFKITGVDFDIGAVEGKGISAGKKIGSITGEVFKTSPVLKSQVITFDILKRNKIDFGGYLDKTGLDKKITLELKKLSPIELENVDFKDDGLHADGKVRTSIPLINAADLRIYFEGSRVSLRKKFNTTDFRLPPPFTVTGSKLEIVATADDLSAGGALNFEIAKVGKGSLEANANTQELSFLGKFSFETALFDQADMNLTYQGGELKGNANLKIGAGKIPGLKEATVAAKYTNAGLEIAGNATPNIPGITSSLSVLYKDGAFTIEGFGRYQNGLLNGNLAFGFTNRVVDENGNPTSAINDRFTPYGNGMLNIKLAKNLQAEAGAKLLRNGEVEMRGAIGISEPVNLFEKKSLEKKLLDYQTKIPLLGLTVGPLNVGLTGLIGGRADFFASIGPGSINKLSANILYNPSHEEKTVIEGKAGFNVPANTGIKLTIPVGLSLDAVVASMEGRLDLGGLLGIDASASAEATLKWSPVGGLEFETLPKIDIKSKLKFDVDAVLAILALGYKKEWRYNILAKELDPALEFKVEFPVHYKEREPFTISTDTIQPTVPEDAHKHIAEEASKEAFIDEHAKEECSAGSSNQLKIFADRSSSEPRNLDWEPDSTEKAVSDLSPPLSKHFRVTQVAYKKGAGGTVTGSAFKDVKYIKPVENLTFNIDKIKDEDTSGVIDPKSVKSALQNSIAIDQLGTTQLEKAGFDNNGLTAAGKLSTEIDLLKDANIDFVIKDDEPSFRKEFALGEFNVPEPFNVTKSSLAIYTEGETVKAQGDVDFDAANLGKGKLTGSFSTEDSLKLSGEFDFDESLFGDAKVRMTYYNGVFSAEGVAKLNIPGLKQGSLSVQLSKDNFKIGGGFALDDNLPGITGGNVKAEVLRKGGKFELSVSGSATPNIPGLNTELDIQYVNKALTIAGKGAYQYGGLTGNITIGVTNQAVDETGKPTGTPGERFRVFGGGDMKVGLTPWLDVTAGAQFLANGQPEVNGAIRMAQPVTFFDTKEIKQEPYETPALTFPLFAIPVFGRNIGLEAKINGGTQASANIGPGRVEEISANLKYNPHQKDRNTLSGKARVALPSHAGLRVFGSAGIGTSAVVASIHGNIELGGNLMLQAPISTEATIGWMGEKGFMMDAKAEASAQTKLKADVNAVLEIKVAIYGTSKWKKALAEKDLGSGMRLGVKFPVKYEAGKGFTLTLSDVEVIKPDINFAGLFTDVAKESFQGPQEG